jgi:hypothetical protein
MDVYNVIILERRKTMETFMSRIRSSYRHAAEGSPALARLGLGSLGLLAASILLMVIDPRELGGAPVWLKPAKFAISIVIASFTLAILLRHLSVPARGGRRAVSVIVATATIELVLITFQAARGVASHFNFSTIPNAVIFQVMGAAIVAFTIAVGYLGVQSFRQRFADRALGWGIRLGFVAMLFGSMIAFAMPRPTPEQLAALKAGRPSPMIGAHTVGAPDGGPGLPVTHWSREGGDLRVPHFIGLHGLQVLPLAGWLLGRRRRHGAGVAVAPELGARLSAIAGAGYIGLTATTLVGALRGRPLLGPDAATLALGGAILLACALAAALAIAFAGRQRQLGASLG